MREQDALETSGAAGEGEESQAHHARRPMNAFLIFCKRHRAVVRDKYPNLENRSITKILGEWWANLDEEEKACYTGLAKQYKDAFFSANPDFKWYKLPAPPLRTLSARAPADRPSDPPTQPYPHQYLNHQHQLDCDMRTNNNSTKYDYNKRQPPLCEETPLTMFTPGKLADEAHMGGISRLLSAASADVNVKYENPYPFTQYSATIPNVVYSESDKSKRSREESIRELQNALTETSRIFEDLDERANEGDIYDGHSSDRMNDNFTNQEIIDKVIDRGLLTKEEPYKTEWNDFDRRTGRSCKGKRYQEFMAMGGLLASKRARRDERDGDYGTSAGWEYTMQGDYSQSQDDSSEHDSEQKLETKSPEDSKQERPENDGKSFKPADFDLDAKIRALPSLSLEKFQEKKRENKKKKKSSFSIKPKEPAKYNQPAGRMQLMDARREAERWRETVIGSQKRKPRKISITRLEVNSMVNRTGEVKSNPEIKIATEAPHSQVPGMDMSAVDCSGGGMPVDLFALATLAEVASNTCKMEEGATPPIQPPTTNEPVYQYHA